MTYLKTLVAVLIIAVAGEFLAGFFELDSTRFLVGAALWVAVRSDLRIGELEKEKQND